MRLLSVLSFLFLIFALRADAVPPVLNYAGQVAVNGEAFDGTGKFKFALVNADGNDSYWSNDGTSVGGSEPQGSIQVPVNGGLYSILLGNTAIQGMSALDPSIFQQYSDAKLRVWFSDGVNGFQQLSLDRPFASVPYAFSAGSAPIAQGSIDHSMLSNALRSDLNSSIKNITRDMLPDSVLSDLNRTITRDMLPPSVLVDLNRTITKSNLGSDVLNDLNSSISLNRLSPEVLAALQVTPSISTQPFARYDWKTDSATIQVSGRGHNLTYQWLKDGQSINGATAPVLELSNPVLDDNATYSVQLTNSVGQTTSQTITLQQAIGAPGLPLEEANASQVPSNGLVLWLDANDLNADGLADNLPTGTLIDSWKSKVGDANATQTSEVLKPKSNFFGDTNLKAVAFDGGDYLLDDNASLPVQHIFAIYRGLYERHDVLISDNIFELVKIDHSSKGIYFYGGKFHNSTGGTVRMSGNSSVGHSVFFSNWQNDLVSMTAGAGGNYNGNFSKLGIGAKTANANNWEGEFGEILFYDRALSNSERDSVERYLADKWSIQLHADKLDAEQAAYDAAKPPAEPESGLQAYYKFEPLAIEPEKVWDYSGNGKHLTMSGFGANRWVEGVDGKALAFDGGNSKASIGTMFDTGSMTLWANTDDPIEGNTEKNVVCYIDYHGGWTYLAFNEAIGGAGRHFALITTHTRGIVSKFDEPKSFNGWFHFAMSFNSNKNQYDYFVNGAIIQSIEIDESSRGSQGRISVSHNSSFNLGNKSTPYYKGLLDEVRVYNRSLTAAEIEGLYLQVDSPILRMASEHNATVGANFSLSLAADNGPTTYLAEGLPAGLSLNTTTGQITGALSQPGYHRVFVKAMNEHGTGSDTIAIIARPQTDQYGWPVDVPDGSAIPQNGLVLWLDANDVDADGEFDTSTDHLKVANWADKAGKDHNATQATAAHQPEIRSGQISGKPNLNVLVFDGNQSLSFPTINQGRTFFWVLRRGSDSDVNAQFFSEKNILSWGRNTYKYYFANAGNPTIYNGICRRNGSVIIANTLNAFFTEFQVLSLSTDDFVNSDLIGKNGHAENYFTGNYGEILVYDRALSETEIETVEKYLGHKWGISISHDTTPSPSGNPATYQVTPANDSVTTAHLTEQILKYLKPEITTHPQANNVYADTNHTFSVTAEGKYLTYQWKKNGTNLVAETNATLTITDANSTQDDGNYSVVVSNDFGSVETDTNSLSVLNTEMTGLIGWWPFEGNAADISGNENHALLVNGPTFTNGKTGSALQMDGSDDRMKIPNTVLNNVPEFSISMWFRKSTNSTDTHVHIFISVANSENANRFIWEHKGDFGWFKLIDSPIGQGVLEKNIFPDSQYWNEQWRKITLVRDSGGASMFVSGKLQIREDYQTSAFQVPQNGLWVGPDQDAIGGGWQSTQHLKGDIDELRIYDRALTTAEVQALYNLGQ